MRKFSFGKRERLAKRPQFEQVLNQGQKHRTGTFYTIFFLPNGLDRKRLGIIASKKIGDAVARNLVKRTQLKEVMNQGQKHRTGTFCTVIFLPNGLDRKRLGIIASKKIGNAVARNLTKRKIREVFRHIKGRIEPAMDIVIVSGRELVSLPVSVIEKKIFQSLPVKR